MMDSYMVDSSGFGTEGEGSLTIGQFCTSLEVGKAYAIVEEGQFQIVMGEFKKLG